MHLSHKTLNLVLGILLFAAGVIISAVSKNNLYLDAVYVTMILFGALLIGKSRIG